MGLPITLYETAARAGVAHSHPHRFRDTFAVDLLCAGAGVYDVARMLGDTVETVEKHYAPLVPALRERVRRIHGNWKWAGSRRYSSRSVARQAATSAIRWAA